MSTAEPSKQYLANAKSDADREDEAKVEGHNSQHEGIPKDRLEEVYDTARDVVRRNERDDSEPVGALPDCYWVDIAGTEDDALHIGAFVHGFGGH